MSSAKFLRKSQGNMSDSSKMEKHVNVGYIRLSGSPAVTQMTAPGEKMKHIQGTSTGDIATTCRKSSTTTPCPWSKKQCSAEALCSFSEMECLLLKWGALHGSVSSYASTGHGTAKALKGDARRLSEPVLFSSLVIAEHTPESRCCHSTSCRRAL